MRLARVLLQRRPSLLLPSARPSFFSLLHPSNHLDRRPSVKRMVLTESGRDLLQVGHPVPDFELPDVTRQGHPRVRLSALARGENVVVGGGDGAAPSPPKALLVCWLCVHCPFVVLLKPALASLIKEYAAKGVATAAVSSNSPSARAEDGPDGMRADFGALGLATPYLFDGGDQAAARSWRVACTPEFFVVDPATMSLLYHGRFDAARPGNGVEPTGADLRRALDAALGGGGGGALPLAEQRRAIGCSIKWSGGEGGTPEYAAALAVKK
jgi:thiol-disulfide isomerase/thioredoxin